MLCDVVVGLEARPELATGNSSRSRRSDANNITRSVSIASVCSLYRTPVRWHLVSGAFGTEDENISWDLAFRFD